MTAQELRKEKVLTDEMLQEIINQIHPLIIEKVGDTDPRITRITDMTGYQTNHYMMMDLISDTYKAAIEELPEDQYVPVGPVYTISYSTEYGTAPASKTVQSMADRKYTLTAQDLPALTAEGYVFAGWSAGGKAVVAGDKIEKDITLVAVWVSSFQITYATDPANVEATGIPADHIVTPDTDGLYELTAFDLPSEVIAEGYELEGYYLDGELIEVGDFIGSEDGEPVEIVAKFVAA